MLTGASLFNATVVTLYGLLCNYVDVVANNDGLILQ